MINLRLFILLGLISLLSSCSSMNSSFSCNVTAGDSCLSMDEVNAMTEGETIRILPKTPQRPRPLIKAGMKRIWIAPFTDKQGKNHAGEYVYVAKLFEDKSA